MKIIWIVLSLAIITYSIYERATYGSVGPLLVTTFIASCFCIGFVGMDLRYERNRKKSRKGAEFRSKEREKV
jgi:uncharacterized BrkB/YihY/UPF0761 family membrane protein